MRARVFSWMVLTAALGRPALADDDQVLANEVRLSEVLRLARLRNAELDEGRLRAQAAEAGARARGRLPDPELKYEQWGVPLDSPLALGRADTLMLGVRQALPAWGARDAEARMAAAQAGAVRATARGRGLELDAQVRKAFAEYERTDGELALHRAHAALTTRLVELARLNYQAGRGTQQDVLRLGLELSRLHADLARIEQERRSSAALLNALVNRAPDAPLGRPVRGAPIGVAPARQERADLLAARQVVERSEAAVSLARQAAWWPAFMIGLDYWYMPMQPKPHAYGAMVTMSLPWLGSRRRDEREEAERTLRADERALEAAQVAARYEVADATARLEAARGGFAIVDRDLLPQAKRSLESAQAAFSVGQGDAVGLLDSLRSYLQVEVERVRGLARIENASAELDRVAGREVAP
jgi:cobalt-zinc-cadmium efflux system outer membrane protein